MTVSGVAWRRLAWMSRVAGARALLTWILALAVVVGAAGAAGCGGGSDENTHLIAFACQRGQSLAICVHDGKTLRRLPQRFGNAVGPVWSPDRSKIAFQCRQVLPRRLGNGFYTSAEAAVVGTEASRNVGGEVCVVGADGQGLIRLTRTGDLAAAPAWSPDGSSIVFAGGIVTLVASVGPLEIRAPGNVHGLFSVPANGGPAKPLTTGAGDDYPVYSPDGASIVFSTGNGQIATIDSDGRSRRLLTRPGDAVDIAPVWSPDGRSIAYTRYVLKRYVGDGTISTAPFRRETWVMTAQGREQRRVISSPVYDPNVALAYRPRWSPDGNQLAITRMRAGALEVVVVPADGGVAQPIGEASDAALGPTWSADGKEIAITWLDARNGDFEIRAYRVEGKGNARIITNDTRLETDAAFAP